MLAVGIAMALLSPVEPPQERDRRPMAPTPERVALRGKRARLDTRGPACGISELLMAPASVSQYRRSGERWPGRARPPRTCLRLVERAPDDLAWQGAGQLAVLQQHGAVDDDMVDADRLAPDLHTAARQARDRLARLLGDRVGVEDRDVGDLAGCDKAAVGNVVHQRRLAGQSVDRLFERHHLLLAHPVAEQVGAGLMPVGGVRPAAAVAGADHGILRA